ncbi:isochorismatase family protein [Nocardioides speluncae]|uniref:isochorismatase family protein n=1 Tax=Nocardioides speluncae TaxID=2670337 RepID=UPI000D6928B7|nr:isochorismatase family protein [Nocardioides speluncae]
MSTLADRPATALLVIDVQNGVIDQSIERDATVANFVTLVEKARAAETPIVWVQHSSDEMPKGSDPWQYVPELPHGESDAVVHKNFGDAFEATDLEEVLAAAGIGHLVVAGSQSDGCVRATIHSAFTRGYDVTLVGDAHTTEDLTAYGAPAPADVVAHTNLYWRFMGAPGKTAAVTETAEVSFG